MSTESLQSPSEEDYSEFSSLWREHENAIREYVRCRTKYTNEIDDILQEVSLTMWNKWGILDHASNFLPWAKSIAHFKVLKSCYKAKKLPTTVTDETLQMLQPAESHFEQNTSSRTDHLQGCLQQLSAEDQQLIKQKYDDEIDGNELAAQLGWRRNYLYKRLGKLKAKLAKCIKTKEHSLNSNKNV